MANQPCILLVSIADLSTVPGGGGPVEISASCPNAAVSVANPSILFNEVAEVTIVPTGVPDGEWSGGGAMVGPSNTLGVTINGSRGGVQHSATAGLQLFKDQSWGGGDWPEADAMRDLFVAWLAAEQSALGITDQTQWTNVPIMRPGPAIGTISDIYLYFSDEWEMYLEWAYDWHAPDDFASIALRRRFSETEYSLSFGVDSYSAVPFEPEAGDPGGLRR